MKHHTSFIGAVFLAIAFIAAMVIAGEGCAMFGSKEAKTVLSAVQVACIIANSESDDSTIQSVCDFTRDMMPIVKGLVSEQKAASRRYADSVAGQCRK